MWNHFVLLLFSFLSVDKLVGSHASSVTPEAYWKLVLPNTLMPQPIKDSLPAAPGGRKGLQQSSTGSLTTLANDFGNGLFWLSYNKKGLTSPNNYMHDGLFWLSYNKKGLTSPSHDYMHDGLFWLSYNKKGLTSPNDYMHDGVFWLSYNKKGLTSPNNYMHDVFWLSYKKQEPNVITKTSYVQDGSNHVNHLMFLEKDLQIGTKMNLEFKKGTNKAQFLPREVVNTIPFSSNKLEEIYKLLSLDPKSKKAYTLSRRIALCEEPPIEGVEKQCVTSLESMVDYVTSKIGNDVKAISTKVAKEVNMEFTIVGVEKLANDHETMVCHKMDYPYALFFCHRTNTMRSYMVSLVGEDGTKMEAIVACHKETNPYLEDYEINVLKVKPGSVHICHFPPADDSIIWVPN